MFSHPVDTYTGAAVENLLKVQGTQTEEGSVEAECEDTAVSQPRPLPLLPLPPPAPPLLITYLKFLHVLCLISLEPYRVNHLSLF